MGVPNAKDGKTKKQQGLDFCNSKVRSGCVGKVEDFSSGDGDEQIFSSRENSQRRHSSISPSRTNETVSGKTINALIEETERQLKYHREQVETLESRLKDLRNTAELVEDDD